MVVLLVLSASSALGMVYSWVDSQGIRYYANKEYDIPERYRAKAKVLYSEQSDTRAEPQNVPEQLKTGGVAATVQPENPPPPVASQVPATAGVIVSTGKAATSKRRARRNSESSD